MRRNERTLLINGTANNAIYFFFKVLSFLITQAHSRNNHFHKTVTSIKEVQ